MFNKELVDGDVRLRVLHLYIERGSLARWYHETLLLSLVAYADMKNHLIHWDGDAPKFDIFAIALGILSFMKDGSQVTRITMPRIIESKVLYDSVTSQMHRVLTTFEQPGARNDQNFVQKQAAETTPSVELQTLPPEPDPLHPSIP